jgi:hypothetical protein
MVTRVEFIPFALRGEGRAGLESNVHIGNKHVLVFMRPRAKRDEDMFFTANNN